MGTEREPEADQVRKDKEWLNKGYNQALKIRDLYLAEYQEALNNV